MLLACALGGLESVTKGQSLGAEVSWVHTQDPAHTGHATGSLTLLTCKMGAVTSPASED